MAGQSASGTSRAQASARPFSGSGRLRYYRPELDLLRFFAFFLVFLSHVVPGNLAFYARAHVPRGVAVLVVGFAEGGAFGVDLFFVLSSFLITTLLLREQAVFGAIDVWSFYVRRMLRIWPLYFAFLLVVAPLLGHIEPSENMPLKYLLAFALLFGNWACVLWGYPHSVASPLWSVSIEEQFYLSWPFLMRRWINNLGVVAAALLGVSFISRLWLVMHGAPHPQIWCNTLARLDPIACGALLAVRAERKEFAPAPRMRAMLLLLGCTTLAAAGHFGDVVGTKALVTYPAVSAACVSLILGTLGLRLSHGPMLRALRYLGRISYGLYVFNAMFVVGIFDVPSVQGPVARPLLAMAALLATIVTAAASYHFLEMPFLRLKERFTRVRSRPV